MQNPNYVESLKQYGIINAQGDYAKKVTYGNIYRYGINRKNSQCDG